MVARDSCMKREPFKGTPLHARTLMNVCTNHYTNLCAQSLFDDTEGWLGGAMVLGNLPVPGRPTI